MKLGLKLGLDSFTTRNQASGLLDEYLPNEAWGLSLLNKNYTGDIILVRRDSDNAERGFKSNEIIDGTLESWIGAGSGYVKTLYNQITDNHLTQLTEGDQPFIVFSGVLQKMPGTDAPALYCGSSGRRGFSVTFSGGPYTQPSTKFVLAHSESSGSNSVFSSSPTDSSAHVVVHLISNGGEININSGVGFTPSSVTNLVNSNCLIYALFNGTSSELGVNGNVASVGNAGTELNSGAELPVLNGVRGYWGLELVYNSNQSVSRTAIETAINSYYSIY